jgi:hypothetical protein
MASLFLAAVLTAAVAVPGAVPLQIDVAVHAGPKEVAPPAGMVRLSAVGGAAMREAKPVALPFRGPGIVGVGLPGGLVWEVRADAEGWWGAPVTAGVVAAPATVALDLWPACELRGIVTVPEGEKAPPSVAVHFATSNPAVLRGRIIVVAEADKPPFGDLVCPVKERRFSCTIAAGTLDVKLKAAGFVPHYLWGKELPAHGVADLGALALKPGASLAGTVVTTEGPADPGTCELRLKPLEAGMPKLDEMDRARARVTTTRADARGFFAFDGLAPGAYTLEARQPGFATAVRAPIRIEPRAETELPDRLVLERPLTLSVEIRPPLDPADNPWTVQVLTWKAGVPGEMRDVFKQTASRQGTLEKKDVGAGAYVAILFDRDGQAYLRQEFELSVTSPPLVLEIRPVPMSGTVTLGEEPLAATLVFGGNSGPKLHSDKEGAFSGVLPREGAWSVQVTASDPPVSRTLRRVEVELNRDLGKAELELRVPNSRLTGTVVDDGGQAVRNATVRLLHKEAVETESALSGDGGRFEFRGLAGGRVMLSAEDFTQGRQRYSSDAQVEVSEDGAVPDVRLVLRRADELVLTVMTESGEPVAGASVWPMGDPSRPGALGFPTAATDALGTVHIPLPRDVERLAGVILAPGYAFQAFDVTLQKDRKASVAVTPLGGTLRLVLPSPLPSGDWSRALLGWQDGIPFPGVGLLQWARVNGVPEDARGTRLTIPQVAPGSYRLCLGPVAALLAEGSSFEGRWEGATCADGFLPRLGELTLELRSPS